jgi:hypothetical protein
MPAGRQVEKPSPLAKKFTVSSAEKEIRPVSFQPLCLCTAKVYYLVFLTRNGT